MATCKALRKIGGTGTCSIVSVVQDSLLRSILWTIKIDIFSYFINKKGHILFEYVTTLWYLCGFSRPTMQGTESVVAVLIPDTSFRLKCWDIRCQWLLCIGRLVSKHRQVMLDCTPGKTGNGEDHWCSSHNWSMRSTPEHVFCCTDDWVCFYLREHSHGASSNAGWHCWTVYCFWGGYTWSFPPSRKNTQAMQDPPELIDVQMVGTVRFWRSLPWVHGDLAGPFISQNLPELISCAWCGCPGGRSEYFQVICGENHMWSRQVSITFWGVHNHIMVPLWF